MNRSAWKVLSIVASLVVTIWAAAVTAHAYCPSTVIAQSESSLIVCKSTGADTQWCYYDCWCTGQQAGCDALYDFVGLVDA